MVELLCFQACCGMWMNFLAIEQRLIKTPLHNAVLHGTADTVRMLLNAGANPNAGNHVFENPFVYGSSSERITARPEWPEIANLLKAAGSETKKSTVNKSKSAACITSGLILILTPIDLECAKY